MFQYHRATETHHKVTVAQRKDERLKKAGVSHIIRDQEKGNKNNGAHKVVEQLSVCCFIFGNEVLIFEFDDGRVHCSWTEICNKKNKNKKIHRIIIFYDLSVFPPNTTTKQRMRHLIQISITLLAVLYCANVHAKPKHPGVSIPHWDMGNKSEYPVQVGTVDTTTVLVFFVTEGEHNVIPCDENYTLIEDPEDPQYFPPTLFVPTGGVRSEAFSSMSARSNLWDSNSENSDDEYCVESDELNSEGFEMTEYYRNPDSVGTDSDKEYLLSTTSEEIFIPPLSSSSGGVGFDFDEEEGQSVGF